MVFCPSKVPTPNENEDKKKKHEPAVTVVDQEPDSKITAETNIEEINGEG